MGHVFSSVAYNCSACNEFHLLSSEDGFISFKMQSDTEVCFDLAFLDKSQWYKHKRCKKKAESAYIM